MSDKKLNILFLTGWYPNRLLPFDGNFVQKHAESVALESNVYVLHACSDINCQQKFEIIESELNNVYAVNVYYRKIRHRIPIISSLQKGIRYFRAYLKGLKFIRKKVLKVDLVHHHILYPSGIIAWYLRKFRKIPYIITEHSTTYLTSTNVKFGRIQKLLSKMIASNAEFISPVSEDLGNAMKKHGLKSNYTIIPNVVDTKLFYCGNKKKSSEKIKLLHVSSLNDTQKNITGMLQVIAQLSKSRQDFECWFVGFGNAKKHIELAKELNIHDRFAFFDGTKTSEEIASIMRDFDGLILYSFYENLPCVMVEAMATGLPILSTNVGGITEHISSKYGMIVELLEETNYLKKMDEFIVNLKNGYYDPNEIRRYAEKHFSNEAVSKQYHQLYVQVLNKRK